MPFVQSYVLTCLTTFQRFFLRGTGKLFFHPGKKFKRLTAFRPSQDHLSLADLDQSGVAKALALRDQLTADHGSPTARTDHDRLKHRSRSNGRHTLNFRASLDRGAGRVGQHLGRQGLSTSTSQRKHNQYCSHTLNHVLSILSVYSVIVRVTRGYSSTCISAIPQIIRHGSFSIVSRYCVSSA